MSNSIKYSICCLFRDVSRYSKLQHSLNDAGFSENVEFLSINNYDNKWDSYQAIRYFTENSKGDYIIICHDDIIISDLKCINLENQIQKVIQYDPTAAVFGIAGKKNNWKRGAGHFFSHRGEERWGFENGGKVDTLDECFLVIKNYNGIHVSESLNGYHFYGTDLCINAQKMGFSCYAIDFPISHLSPGSLDKNFYEARDKFQKFLYDEKNYKLLYTTCTCLYGGSSTFYKIYSLVVSLWISRLSIPENYNSSQHEIRLRGDALIGVYLFYICTLNINLYIRVRYWSNIIFWKILWPLSWPVRRLSGDLFWWCKNWRKRINR